jgi:LacI family transcriptional regulator
MKKILVRLLKHDNAAMRIADGIMRYAKARTDWEVQFIGFHPAMGHIRTVGSWQPDGLITEAPYGGSVLRSSSLQAAVFVSRPIPRNILIPYGVSVPNDAAIGRLAADFLVRKGLSNFASVPSPDDDIWSRERIVAFREALSARGFPVSEYTIGQKATNWGREYERLNRFLAALPKPCGVFAAFDQRAKHILDICRGSGIPVPEQMHVLGVDNEEWVCENTIPALSSIDPGFHSGGYAAAERLDALLRGETFADPLVRFAPKCVMERRSTSDRTQGSRNVSAAIEFIRRNALEDIGIADIVRASGTSLRLLQRHFATIAGRGIAATLRHERLERACRLLEKTENPISVITDHCRLGDEFNAKTLFRKAYGMSMRDWRETHRDGPRA